MTQLSIDFARAQGETAGEACQSKARRVSNFDSEGAARYIHGYLICHGATAGEILTEQAIAHGFRCHDARAFGPVFAKLARRNLIRCVGYCARKHGHGTAGGRVWEAMVD